MAYAPATFHSLISTCATSTTTCTTQYRNLLTSIRDQLGYCINAIYNDSTNTISELYMPIPFSYALWSSCGIEAVTEQCTSSTILLPQTQMDSSCTTADYISQSGYLMCTQRYIQPILDRLLAAGSCQSFYQSVLEQCGVDAIGEPCYSQTIALQQGFTNAFI